jgi:hypothetical protein
VTALLILLHQLLVEITRFGGVFVAMCFLHVMEPVAPTFSMIKRDIFLLMLS